MLFRSPKATDVLAVPTQLSRPSLVSVQVTKNNRRVGIQTLNTAITKKAQKALKTLVHTAITKKAHKAIKKT